MEQWACWRLLRPPHNSATGNMTRRDPTDTVHRSHIRMDTIPGLRMTLMAVIGARRGGDTNGANWKSAANTSGVGRSDESMIATIEIAGVIATVGER